MNIRDATVADIPFIVSANTALARETEGQVLDPACCSRASGRSSRILHAAATTLPSWKEDPSAS